MDICGPVNRNSSGGARYILTFIDDHQRYAFVYFLKNKGQTYDTFKKFKAMFECQTGKKEVNGIKRQLTTEWGC